MGLRPQVIWTYCPPARRFRGLTILVVPSWKTRICLPFPTRKYSKTTKVSMNKLWVFQSQAIFPMISKIIIRFMEQLVLYLYHYFPIGHQHSNSCKKTGTETFKFTKTRRSPFWETATSRSLRVDRHRTS